jgi:hypothetical protein
MVKLLVCQKLLIHILGVIFSSHTLQEEFLHVNFIQVATVISVFSRGQGQGPQEGMQVFFEGKAKGVVRRGRYIA